MHNRKISLTFRSAHFVADNLICQRAINCLNYKHFSLNGNKKGKNNAIRKIKPTARNPLLPLRKILRSLHGAAHGRHSNRQSVPMP